MRAALNIAFLALGVFISQEARSSPPEPKLMKRFQARQDSLARAREAAGPWKAALEKAFATGADTISGKETANLIFLSTYKHYSPPGKADRDLESAQRFLAAWKTLAVECTKANQPPLGLSRAIYELTNSDWAPVSFATGPGLDKLAAPADLRVWGLALIAFGKRAQAAKMDPAVAWRIQAKSYRVREPGDLAEAELNPPPVAL
ncbi:MAG: hypothetical protein JF616_20930 [Fibrobacteres bacterium]|jgi:hypothetical protein|nr:hypothetical protein [Fibrobacterota bacterium]